ncbi:MAG: spore germination protein, partial [Clostridia bacterium]|nr:spore germination protein [Clostridia bacterium]
TVEIGKTGFRASVFYMDGMVNTEILNESVIKPLILANIRPSEISAEKIEAKILFAGEVSKTTTLDQAIRGVLYGDTLLMIEGEKTVFTINTKGWRTRGVTEPSDERVLKGPREGFDEAALLNVALIRRKLLTPDLCVELQRVGRRTETLVFICYLESLADKGILKELKKRIAAIDIDGILDSNYIAELIGGKRLPFFKNMGTTERPDIVAARLLEGRIAIIVDGTPVVLTIPYLFSENFQSDEDYYVNYLIASASRMMRYVCFFLAVSVPAVFVALLTHHLGLLPTNFMLSVSALREGVPMSSVTECVLLILIFEILKETGLRTPQSQGFALSIVGGLVVGQAAVEAKIVSAPMLIAVALSGIAGLMIPRLRNVVFYLRFILVFLSALLGLYGYIIGFSMFLLLSLSIKSFGVDTVPSLASPQFSTFKDTFFRASWRKMYKRPMFNANKTRLTKSDKND